MKLIISGKQIDVGDALRTHVTERLAALVGKYYDSPIDATVTFSREAHLFHTDITVHFGAGLTVNAQGEGTEIYGSFDVASDRAEKRLRRYKRRLKNHHHGATRTLEPALSYVISPREDDEDESDAHVDGAPLVIAENESEIETLTVSEAVFRLDLGAHPAMMFRNSANGGLNVVYRRPDGNIGWIEPNKPSSGVAV
ncbi:ribosome-associated translation inhibitor RaiA [Zavarzinia compransoris]|uniref:ribosome hibernation-promoting factor, HPF/YfiA family n=1 Tax=Zavarzinia marina TaxID=2911065 RepID=UPI001F2F8DAF|nr:ribosome-associated translation inhibitor RaiA [Zavarzinia marina]MCF4166024.1 ribosome-associated translation inhibitor RaiA [Zavarzinia marina]